MGISNIPKGLLDSATDLLSKVRAFEEAPPNKSIQKWIEENKETYDYQYGDQGKSLLYARAWAMFKEDVDDAHRALGEADSLCKYGMEEDSIEFQSDDEVDSDEDNALLKRKAGVDAQSGLPELGESGAEQLDPDLDGIPANTKSDEHDIEEEDEKEDDQLAENYASPEPSSAIGFRTADAAVKHADVLYDTHLVGEEKIEGYRLLIQYPNGTQILPPTDLSPASSIEELGMLSAHLNDPFGQIVAAVEAAFSFPSDQPQYRGNDKE